jgi:4-amino-4-deoxy-L-arabinose transferase-like glycosyltransferase
MLKTLMNNRGTDMLFLALVVFAVYGRIIGHDFINWDDESYVVFNQAITGFTWEHLKEAFSTNYVGNYAPLHIISYMLDYTLWGMYPGGFLFMNVVLHSVNGILWYRMLLRWYEDRLLAVVAACLFLVHPVQVETVAWVSQRKNLLAMLLFLVAWNCYCCFREAPVGRGWSSYIVSVAAFGLAILTKSVVVIFPLVLLWYDFCFEEADGRFQVKDKIPFFLLSAGGVALAVFSQSQELNGGRVGYHGGSAWYTFLTMVPVLCSYISMIVWPTSLSALYSPLLRTSIDGAVLSSAALLVMISGAGFALYRRDRRSGFWVLLWLIGLLPVLQIIPLNTLISDRYLYFPMLGVSALTGVGCAYVVKRAGVRHGVLARTLIAGVLMTLALLSFFRAEKWKDSLTLWKDAVAKVPESSRAWGNLGAAYQRIDAPQEAFEAYQRGLELYPDNEQILYNLGTMYYYAGDNEEAQRYFQRLPSGYRIDGVVPLFDTRPVKQ